LFEALRKMADLHDAVKVLGATVGVACKENNKIWTPEHFEKVQRINQTLTAFNEAKVLVEAACGPDPAQALQVFKELASEIGVRLGEWDVDFYNEKTTELGAKAILVKFSVRKELGIDAAA
jgi:hypothetical protein